MRTFTPNDSTRGGQARAGNLPALRRRSAMSTWIEIGEAVDQLIHDAEHAEAGRDFAQMMNQRDPANPQHRQAARDLDAKALKLRIEAMNAFDASLQQTHGHVRKHPAGLLARCGGPAICADCQIEQHLKELVLTPRPNGAT